MAPKAESTKPKRRRRRRKIAKRAVARRTSTKSSSDKAEITVNLPNGASIAYSAASSRG